MNDVTFKYAKDCEDTEIDNGGNLRAEGRDLMVAIFAPAEEML